MTTLVPGPTLSNAVWTALGQLGINIFGLAMAAAVISQVVDCDLSVEKFKAGVHMKGNAFLQLKKASPDQPAHPAKTLHAR